MPVQPNLFHGQEPNPTLSPEFTLEPAKPIPVPEPVPEPSSSSSAPVWLQRISLFILVLFCVYLGIIVAILPWWTSVWDHNLFFQSRPWLWSVLRLGAVRGIISGLGILDIWIGISEAIHYRDDRP